MGGFPAVLESGRPEDLLKEYYKVMFYRDLIERYKIKNVKLFEDYLTLLIDQTASNFSISSIAKKLNEFGYSFSKNTLSNFLRYAQEVFLLFETKKHSYKIKERLRSPKKIYAVDHGLIQAIRLFILRGLWPDVGKYRVYFFKENMGRDILLQGYQQNVILLWQRITKSRRRFK